MQFYLVIKYILRFPPPGKLVPPGQKMEGGSKNAELFTGV